MVGNNESNEAVGKPRFGAQVRTHRLNQRLELRRLDRASKGARALGSFHDNVPFTPAQPLANEGDISPSVSTTIPGPRGKELIAELTKSAECGAVHFMVSPGLCT